MSDLVTGAVTAVATLLVSKTDFVKNVLDAPSKEIGEQLANMINLAFEPIQKWRIEKDVRLQVFTESIKNKYLKIPDKELIPPQISILGPALEASKYYYEQDEIRDMFANLVANLFDKRLVGQIHPAYVEVLKQLTPLEAKLLSAFRPKTGTTMFMSFKKYEDEKLIEESEQPKDLKPSYYTFPETVMPIVNYWFVNDTGRVLIQNNVIISDIFNDFNLSSAFIINLQRLGLIEFNYSSKLGEDRYQIFLKHQNYLDWHNDFIINKDNKAVITYIRGHMIAPGQYKRIELEKGIVRLTQFGYNFMSACVIEAEVILN
jgi:hypothetical protein